MMMNAMQQAALQQHRRVRSLGSSHATPGNERDEDLVLFHEMQKRERAAISSSVTQTLQRDPSAISEPRNKAGSEDIFTSSEWGKNDYDWLLTPPATPLIPNLDHEAVGNCYSLSGAASTRSVLKTTSRLGISRSEPPSRAEPVSRIVRGTLGVQKPANNAASLSSSTNSISKKSLPSSTVATSRPSTPSSNGRPSTPVSQPAARPFTPTRTAGAPRVSTSSSSIRPSTPTGRSSIVSSTRAASSSGPSLARSASTSASASAIRAASASASLASTRPGASSSRASTPVKRPATPTRTANPPSTITANPPSTIMRSSSVSRTSALPQSKSAASSRPSSPSSRVRQPVAHPAVLPGFSQEPPPNLRTSMPDRPLSNSRGSVASRASGTKLAQPEVTSNNARSLRLSSSPLTTRGRVSSDSLNSEKSLSKGKPHDALQSTLSNGIQSKMVDRTVSTRKPLVLPEKPSAGISSQVKKPVKSSPVRDLKSTTPSVRESTGFGRNLSKKSLDMALRHMDIRKNTPSSFKSFMSNVPTSSLYSVRSSNGRGLSSSSVADSPMATSSNASSEHSFRIAIDQEGSEIGDEMVSEKGSKTSPISQPDSYNERKVNSWLGSPNYANGNNADILQVFEQGIERLSSTESPLISHSDGGVKCDNFTLEPIQ
ncbi:hypothetical protein GOP47_0019738 [Adiantum capillus-veneris]|uniref:Uncharacterized protein n=1 Tax=Adiantum capillus-veneris TaxID=13818 RepID=A0A9D4UCL2_ADICA|nr:hypothetical protein GOP47_0019738 [Adiantum capillus-veneris]